MMTLMMMTKATMEDPNEEKIIDNILSIRLSLPLSLSLSLSLFPPNSFYSSSSPLSLSLSLSLHLIVLVGNALQGLVGSPAVRGQVEHVPAALGAHAHVQVGVAQ